MLHTNPRRAHAAPPPPLALAKALAIQWRTIRKLAKESMRAGAPAAPWATSATALSPESPATRGDPKRPQTKKPAPQQQPRAHGVRAPPRRRRAKRASERARPTARRWRGGGGPPNWSRSAKRGRERGADDPARDALRPPRARCTMRAPPPAPTSAPLALRRPRGQPRGSRGTPRLPLLETLLVPPVLDPARRPALEQRRDVDPVGTVLRVAVAQ